MDLQYYMVLLLCFVAMTSGEEEFGWDARGYIIYCPCMGRFGNQAEHFLGALGFSKDLDRTLVLPPWRTYKNVPFDEYFQVEPLRAYHRVILAEDFMRDLAPEHWPPDQRSGWCWKRDPSEDGCNMKEGNPFGPFWDGLGIDFVSDVIYQLTYDEYNLKDWKRRFPPSDYPVMALRGAPASFPVKERHVSLHQYLKWSDAIEQQAQKYIDDTFHGEPFAGVHLRNGQDWVNACEHAEKLTNYMASPQCLGYIKDQKVTAAMCFPPKEEVLRLTEKVMIETKAKYLFIATDKNPMIKDFQKHLNQLEVSVHHLDPWLPQLDQAILGKSQHFIGNCVSSFTSFVARERSVTRKPTSYWGYTK